MAEYIDLDKAVLVADIRGRELKTTVRHILGINKGIYDTADVHPVRHGRWERTSKSLMVCTACGNCVVDDRISGMFYCPNCGAKMQVESNE